MKRLAAMLMSCMLIASAFAACEDEDDISSGKTGTTKASVEATTGDDAAETTEASTEEKTTTAEMTTASRITAAAEKTTSEKIVSTEPTFPPVDPSDYNGGDIVGTWWFDDEGEETTMIFKPDNTIDMFLDMSEMLSFRNGKLMFDEDEENGIDYTFDGKKLSVVYEEQSFLEMERVSGETSKSDINGDYKITGGLMQGLLSSSDESIANCIYTIDGEKVFITYSRAFTYETDGNQFTMSSATGSESESDFVTYGYYDVSGDTLTMADENNEVVELKRVK